ncbi:MAG: AAA family ATPase [Succinivibrionaceae bacterium]
MSEGKVVLLKNPYGVSAYENLRKNGRAFVDKSSLIKELDINSSPYPVLLRPRRFGKSTFVHMLKCFYDISYKDRYEEIFSGTDIYKENLESHNTYHVLHFNFSSVSGDDKQSLIESFTVALTRGTSDFIDRYPDFVFKPSEIEKKNPSSFIKSFINAYVQYPLKKSLYVMIDEYDNFANSVLSKDFVLFKEITSSGGFFKDFYAAIKEGTESCIAKTFITGVSSVSLDSLTSGFNIARNITSIASFNEYAGFTKEELSLLIPQLVDIQKIGVSVDEIIARMKPVYDGYCFSQEAELTVFNSSMCLYYLDEMRNKGRFLPPEKYMDPASDHDGSKLKQLFDIAEDGLADEIIETYLESAPEGEQDGGCFYIEGITENINLNKAAKYNRDQLLSMLYYLGYLTINNKLSRIDRLALKVPNRFMSKLFAQCVADLQLKTSPVFTNSELDISSLRDVEDDISPFATSCTEFLSCICTNHVLNHMSEMALNLTLYTKLYSMRGIFVEMQKSLRLVGKGEKFADLVITVNKCRSNECIYLIELKYLSKSQHTEKKLLDIIDEASAQVLRYKSSIDFQNKNVKAYVMVFVGTECKYCQMQ